MSIATVASSPASPFSKSKLTSGVPETVIRSYVFFRAEVHLQVERDDFLAVASALAYMMDPRDLAGPYCQVRYFHPAIREHGSDFLRGPLEVEPESVGEQEHGLEQTDVAKPRPSMRLGETAPRSCPRQPSSATSPCAWKHRRGVPRGRELYIDAGSGRRQRHRVHDESRVYPGAEDGDVPQLRHAIELSRLKSVTHNRVQKLLTGAHDIGAFLDALLDLWKNLLETGPDREDHNGRSLHLQHFIHTIRDAHFRGTFQFGQIRGVSLLFLGIVVDGTHELDVTSTQEKFRRRESNLTKAENNNSGFL
jgi:hypothetical protein